jgi:outer membrane protein W
LGATFGLSGRGGGGGFRYFFNDRFGMNVVAGYSRPATIGGTSLGPSVAYVAPSVVYMLTPMNTKADVDLRPYVGGGVSYGGATRTPGTGGATGVRSNGFGLGGQAFGGVELSFKDVKAATISAEVAHYEVKSPYSAGPIIRGTNFFLTFHFFLN